MRLGAALSLLAAIVFPKHKAELAGVGVAVLAFGYVSRTKEEDWLINVFDEGDCLRFELDGLRESVSIGQILSVEFQDGGDGMDLVAITLSEATSFGRVIEFIPEPVHVFEWSTKLWFKDLQKRVSETKTSVC